MDKAQAIKASRNGVIACFISGGLTLAVFLYTQLVKASSGKLALFNDPLILVDIGFVFVCGFGVLKKSRVAAVSMFIFFIISKISIFLETKSFSGPIALMALIFIYFFGKAIQGTFIYHKFEKDKNFEYKPLPQWIFYVGIGIISIILAFIIIGLENS